MSILGLLFFSSRRRHTRFDCDWSADVCFFVQAEDGIRDLTVTGVQTCALPIYLTRDFKEIPSISTSHICNAAKLSFAPEQVIVVEFWDPIQVNGIDGNHSPLFQTGESGDNYVTARCKRHSAVERDRRSVFLVPDPSGS